MKKANEAMQRWLPEHFAQYTSAVGTRYHWTALTFTFKQAKKRDDKTWQPFTEEELSKCIKHLLKALNRKVYGPAFRRGRKRLRVITMMERSKSGRLHVHMVLQIPDHFAGHVTPYYKIIKQELDRLRWMDRQHDFKVLKAEADVINWIRYMGKGVSWNADLIDFNNTHF